PGWGLADDGSIQWHRVHPETGVAIEGLQVPRWQDLLSTALRAARAFPQMPFIGWDVLVTEEGPALLEANTLPALPVWQVHEPLLDDPRSRAFFEHYRLA
ncbi:MAG: sugar-transfer associated ATP-grasp domain-containing protein, partial [Acidobacteriota bacterium]|nr:sugar-transfer associated ATP-grasp domain-containing protein [Acidobacteriota bacterium]